MITASGFSYAAKWPPLSWTFRYVALNQAASEDFLNASTRFAVVTPGGFSKPRKVMPTGASTAGLRSCDGCHGYRAALAYVRIEVRMALLTQ
jgi:hypothetical protein